MKFPHSIKNDPSKAGKRARKIETFGEFSRFAIYPIHTRFEAVCWIVLDALIVDEFGLASVIRQASSKESALEGLEEVYSKK